MAHIRARLRDTETSEDSNTFEEFWAFWNTHGTADYEDVDVFSRCMQMLRANATETHEVERDKQETWRRLVQWVKRDLGINE